MAHVMVDPGGVGPVRLGCDDAEALRFDQPLRNSGSQTVELRSPMAGFANEHDAGVADTAHQRLEVGIFHSLEDFALLSNKSRDR